MTNQVELLNEDEAYAFLQRLQDPVQRRVVEVAFAALRLRFFRKAGETETSYVAGLPQAPFDAKFFVQVLAEAFKDSRLF